MSAGLLTLEKNVWNPASNHPQTDGDKPRFNSVTIFTNRWREIRDFYVELLDAKVIAEVPDRYCEMELGGLPLCLRKSEYGESVSYFHLSMALKNRDPVLRELRKRGIIVTQVGPFVNFRDPEGRVIKLAEEAKPVA